MRVSGPTLAVVRSAPVGGAPAPAGTYGGRFFHLMAWTPRLQQPIAGLDPQAWRRSGSWANGGDFACGWRPENARFERGGLLLRLTDQPTAGMPYAGGEIATLARLTAGRVEACIQPVRAPGVITSLFTYTGPSEGQPHHEIDVEFLGDDTTKVQLGYFTDGRHYAVEKIDLGFDASLAPHTYGFEFGPQGITWFVDGRVVKREDGRHGPLPSRPQRVLANLWPTRGVDGWAGRFVYPGRPLEARYDWIQVTPS